MKSNERNIIYDLKYEKFVKLQFSRTVSKWNPNYYSFSINLSEEGSCFGVNSNICFPKVLAQQLYKVNISNYHCRATTATGVGKSYKNQKDLLSALQYVSVTVQVFRNTQGWYVFCKNKIHTWRKTPRVIRRTISKTLWRPLYLQCVECCYKKI